MLCSLPGTKRPQNVCPGQSSEGTVTDADRDAANAGHLITIPTAGAAMPVRYLRISQQLTGWGYQYRDWRISILRTCLLINKLFDL